MTQEEIKINPIARSFGTSLIKSGISVLRSTASEFTPVVYGIRILNDALDKAGIKIPVIGLDYNYYYTSWDNWKKIIDVLYGVIKDFKWESESRDCDNRSNLMTSLCSILFGLNTCAGLYCEVYDLNGNLLYLHWANLIITNGGQLWLFDVDNKGQTSIITSGNIVIGDKRYKLLSIRIY